MERESLCVRYVAILKEVICEYKNELCCKLLVIRFINRCHASVFVSASDVFYLIVQSGQKLPSFLTMASQCFTAWREFDPTWSLSAYWSLPTSRLFCSAGLWQVVHHFHTTLLHILCFSCTIFWKFSSLFTVNIELRSYHPHV